VVIIVEVVRGDLDKVVLRLIMSLVVDAHLRQGALHGFLELNCHLVCCELAFILLLLDHGVILLLIFLLFLVLSIGWSATILLFLLRLDLLVETADEFGRVDSLPAVVREIPLELRSADCGVT
jgi:hypothetical protein